MTPCVLIVFICHREDERENRFSQGCRQEEGPRRTLGVKERIVGVDEIAVHEGKIHKYMIARSYSRHMICIECFIEATAEEVGGGTRDSFT